MVATEGAGWRENHLSVHDHYVMNRHATLVMGASSAAAQNYGHVTPAN